MRLTLLDGVHSHPFAPDKALVEDIAVVAAHAVDTAVVVMNAAGNVIVFDFDGQHILQRKATYAVGRGYDNVCINTSKLESATLALTSSTANQVTVVCLFAGDSHTNEKCTGQFDFPVVSSSWLDPTNLIVAMTNGCIQPLNVSWHRINGPPVRRDTAAMLPADTGDVCTIATSAKHATVCVSTRTGAFIISFSPSDETYGQAVPIGRRCTHPDMDAWCSRDTAGDYFYVLRPRCRVWKVEAESGAVYATIHAVLPIMSSMNTLGLDSYTRMAKGPETILLAWNKESDDVLAVDITDGSCIPIRARRGVVATALTSTGLLLFGAYNGSFESLLPRFTSMETLVNEVSASTTMTKMKSMLWWAVDQVSVPTSTTSFSRLVADKYQSFSGGQTPERQHDSETSTNASTTPRTSTTNSARRTNSPQPSQHREDTAGHPEGESQQTTPQLQRQGSMTRRVVVRKKVVASREAIDIRGTDVVPGEESASPITPSSGDVAVVDNNNNKTPSTNVKKVIRKKIVKKPKATQILDAEETSSPSATTPTGTGRRHHHVSAAQCRLTEEEIQRFAAARDGDAASSIDDIRREMEEARERMEHEVAVQHAIMVQRRKQEDERQVIVAAEEHKRMEGVRRERDTFDVLSLLMEEDLMRLIDIEGPPEAPPEEEKEEETEEDEIQNVVSAAQPVDTPSQAEAADVDEGKDDEEEESSVAGSDDGAVGTPTPLLGDESTSALSLDDVRYRVLASVRDIQSFANGTLLDVERSSFPLLCTIQHELSGVIQRQARELEAVGECERLVEIYENQSRSSGWSSWIPCGQGHKLLRSDVPQFSNWEGTVAESLEGASTLPSVYWCWVGDWSQDVWLHALYWNSTSWSVECGSTSLVRRRRWHRTMTHSSNLRKKSKLIRMHEDELVNFATSLFEAAETQ